MIEPISAGVVAVKGIAIIAKVIAGAIVIGWAWAYIRNFFMDFLIPAIRKHVSDTLADGVAKLVSWVDAPMSAMRNVARETMISFKKRVLGIKTTYERKNAYSVQEKTASYILKENGSVQEIVREKEISMDKLPPEVRAEFIKHHGSKPTTDVKKDFEQIVKKELDLAV